MLEYWFGELNFNASVPMIMSITALIGMLAFGNEWTRVFALLMIKSGGILVCLININAGQPYIPWNIAAILLTFLMFPELDRMNALNGRWKRRERKLMKQLFGEPTNLYEVFMMDPRLARNKKEGPR